MFKKLLTVHWPPLSTKKGGKRKKVQSFCLQCNIYKNPRK